VGGRYGGGTSHIITLLLLETVNTVATVVVALGVIIALYAYLGAERTARVDQTFLFSAAAT